MPAINAALQGMGHTVGDSEAAEVPAVAGSNSKLKREKKSSKANIEATSDEDEDD